MRNNHLLFLLAAGLVLSLTGCEKEPDAKNGDPQEVRFSVATANPETKTHYTGQGTGTAGNLSWERISWDKDDPLLIWSDYAVDRVGGGTHAANYVVGTPITVEEGGKQSWSILKDNADLGLIYDDTHSSSSDTYSFWSIYPATAATAAPAGGTGTDANKVSFLIPATQEKSGDAVEATINRTVNNVSTTFKVDSLKPNMNQAVMLAAVEGAAYNSDIELKYYPAFTAFEFELLTDEEEFTLSKVILTSNDDLAGTVTAEVKAGTRNDAGSNNYIGASTYNYASTAKSLTFNFPEGGIKLTPETTEGETTTPAKGVIFTVFALPQDIEGMTLEFFDADGNSFAKGTLKYGGNDITFAAGKKHCIRGIYVKNTWKFKYLTLDIKVLDWDELESTYSNGSGVQSTQFAISFDDDGDEGVEHNLRYVKGNDKAYRQCWVFTSDNTATVTYKIMMPTETTGKWSIEKCGDVDYFTVAVTSPAGATWDGNTVSGNLSGDTATYITFTITTSATDLKTLYFKTYVSDGTDTYSLDSETQLYDMRGYHYFIANGSASTTWDDINL